MMRSLFSGVSGLKEHQTMMDVIGNNIANVNTTGFKSSRVIFEDMISQTESGASAPMNGFGGVNPKQVGLGVVGGTIDTLFTQGNLQTSGKSTDLAIQGNGFFIMRQGNSVKLEYTRNGALDIDSANYLVNPGSGMKVQGWMPDATDTITTSMPVSDIKVPIGELITAKQSTSISYVGNINSESAADPTSQYETTVKLYDSLGNDHLVTVTYEKIAPNQWTWTASGTGITVGAFNTGTIDFDANGAFVANTGSLELDTTASGSVNPMDVNIDFTGITQFGTPNSVTAGEQDGYAPGVLESFSISQDGVISGIYSNGSTRSVGQIALASFRNPGGLIKGGNSDYLASANSGIPQIGEAMTASRGTITAGTLEMSNVDLSNEFTNMIIAQRGFQANSKTIQTADDMLNTLVNLKR